MGYKLTKFSIVPCENEQIDAVIKVCKEERSVFYGVVLDECNEPVEDAVVKLLEINEDGCLDPKYHAFTDEDGQFLFGPLNPGVEYVIKIWIKHEKSRRMVIHNDCDDCHDKHNKHNSCHDHAHCTCNDNHHKDKHSCTCNNEPHNPCDDECYDSWGKKENHSCQYHKVTHKINKPHNKNSKNYRGESDEFESIKD